MEFYAGIAAIVAPVFPCYIGWLFLDKESAFFRPNDGHRSGCEILDPLSDLYLANPVDHRVIYAFYFWNGRSGLPCTVCFGGNSGAQGQTSAHSCLFAVVDISQYR